MKSSLKTNTPILFVLFVMAIFISTSWVQKTNNALPFFYKNYPTYENNGKKNFDSVSESLVLNRIDFSTLSLEYTSKFNLWRANHEVRAFTDTGTGKSFDKEYITTPDYLLDGQSYQSQIGAQSLFFATLAKILNTDHGHYSSIKAISVFLLSMCAAIILLWIKINFGTIPSAVSRQLFGFCTINRCKHIFRVDLLVDMVIYSSFICSLLARNP